VDARQIRLQRQHDSILLDRLVVLLLEDVGIGHDLVGAIGAGAKGEHMLEGIARFLLRGMRLSVECFLFRGRCAVYRGRG
jgi:hypothetical protein